MRGELKSAEDDDSDSGLGVDIEEKEQSADFQRYATDLSELLKMNFRMTLCCWEEVQEHSGITSKLFEGQSVMTKRFAPRKNGIKMCNESCSDSLASGLFGMVSHVTQLSIMSETQIFRLWDGYKHDVRMLLLRNIYLEHNTYEIKEAYLYYINAFHTSQIPATYKAKGGQTMKAFTEQVMSVFSSQLRSGMPMQPQQSQGIGERLGNLLKIKK